MDTAHTRYALYQEPLERGTAQQIYDRENENIHYSKGDQKYEDTCFAALNNHCPLGVDDTAKECEACAMLKWEKDLEGLDQCTGMKKYIGKMCESNIRTRMEKKYVEQHKDTKAGMSRKMKSTMECNRKCCVSLLPRMQSIGLSSLLAFDPTTQCPSMLDNFPHWSPCDFLQQRRFRKTHGFVLKAAEKNKANVKRAKLMCPCSLKCGGSSIKQKQAALLHARKVRVEKKLHSIPKQAQADGLYVQKQVGASCGAQSRLQIGEKARVLITAWRCKPVTYNPDTGVKVKKVKECTYHPHSDQILGLQQYLLNFNVGERRENLEGVMDAARGMCKMEVRDIIIPPVLAFGQEERMVFGTKLEENQWIFARIRLINEPHMG
eukprot:g2239.t1